MELDKLFVLVGGIAGVAFVAWFFFGKKDDEVKLVEKNVTIEVAGGYKPSSISIPKGRETILKFHRTDPSDCLEEVVLPDFKVRKKLPLNETVSIALTPQRTGEFPFSCGMNMFHGRIFVKD